MLWRPQRKMPRLRLYRIGRSSRSRPGRRGRGRGFRRLPEARPDSQYRQASCPRAICYPGLLLDIPLWKQRRTIQRTQSWNDPSSRKQRRNLGNFGSNFWSDYSTNPAPMYPKSVALQPYLRPSMTNFLDQFQLCSWVPRAKNSHRQT